MYWKKLRHIAEKVTDTEVRLNLPNQTTPKGRGFCVEGVVDIVREDEKVTMYDIKTHDLAVIATDTMRRNIKTVIGRNSQNFMICRSRRTNKLIVKMQPCQG